MTSFSGASSSGWRWGRCVRCVTCPSYSWRSSREPPRWRPWRSSPCLEWRTWCSLDVLTFSSSSSYLHPQSLYCTGTLKQQQQQQPSGTSSLSCSDGFISCHDDWVPTKIKALLFYFFVFRGQWRFKLFHTKALFWGHQRKRWTRTIYKVTGKKERFTTNKKGFFFIFFFLTSTLLGLNLNRLWRW